MIKPSFPAKPTRLKIYHPSGRTTTFFGVYTLACELETGEVTLGIFKVNKATEEVDLRTISLVNVIATVQDHVLLWSPRYGSEVMNNFVDAYLNRHPEWPRILELTPAPVDQDSDDRGDDDDDMDKKGTLYPLPT